jgi:D-alanine-D-alanine ligase
MLRVAVLRGGPSSEREVSLRSGETVLRELAGVFDVADILVDSPESWRRDGRAQSPAEAMAAIDVAFVALHGEFGEDGQVQRILEELGVPYTGSGVEASALAMDKPRSKESFVAAGIPVPAGVELDVSAMIPESLGLTFPLIVKPADGGSSVGASAVSCAADLPAALAACSKVSRRALLEEMVVGREFTVGVEEVLGAGLRALPAVEIVPPESGLWGYEQKYSGETREICPADSVGEALAGRLASAAMAAHRAVSARDYSRADFIVRPDGGFVILEINTLPGLTATSLLPLEISVAGDTLANFLRALVERAARRTQG